jgi:hypothetical protein
MGGVKRPYMPSQTQEQEIDVFYSREVLTDGCTEADLFPGSSLRTNGMEKSDEARATPSLTRRTRALT